MVLWLNCCNGSNGYQQIAPAQGPRFGVRHFQCFLVFCGLAVAYALRVNLSVAIVAMTDRNGTNPNFEEFDWNESIKSYLLSSFFWGYVITQVPGGFLAHKYGAKYTFFFGILICSTLTIMTPLCARWGNWPCVLALRTIEGLSQGMIFPSTHTFLSKWAPMDERGRLVSYCYSGTQFGTVVMLSVSGFIASSWMGWPSIFYISGMVGLLWAVVWYYCAFSTPASHPSISPMERLYIESTGQGRRPSDAIELDAVQHHPPWRHIFTSIPFLTLLLVHCAYNWGFWTLLTEIPTYMKNILGMDIRSNGPLSALPYFVMCLLSYAFIYLNDFINRNSVMPLFFSRKLFNSIGFWLPMMALIGLGYIKASGDSYKLAIALLIIAVGTSSATYLGFQVNHIDLAPNFAGTLMGITNCAANIMSIIAPLTVGVIVTNEKNALQWRIVFFITAAFYFVGNLLFIVFGRTSTQKWNFPATPTRSSNSTHDSNIEATSNDETTPLHSDTSD